MTDTTKDTEHTRKDQVEELEKFASAPAGSSQAIQFPEVPPKDYDTKLIQKFLDAVFHAGLDDEEHILTWMVKPNSQPFHPKSEGRLLELLDATRQPKALYYATATCMIDPEDGKLHHKKSLFQSLRVVVLDDIGTKIPVDKIPEDFPPSYIIESSAGNFQYGYILDEPVEELPAAEALIQLVYESGYSDEGGKTPVKLVRLPDGVNGKKGEKGKFISQLTSLTDVTYTPQQILDSLHLNVDWNDVLKDAEEVTKRRASRSLGATPWATVAPQAQAMNGFIDPVLEWLYETEQVSLDNQGPWVDIKCPWSEGHTTGKSTARYAPLGRGENVEQRGFKCFHDNCASTNTAEFLKYVASVSGIQAGVHDPAAQLCTRYVFDKIQNSAWDIKSDKRDMRIPMSAFSTLHPHKTTIQTVDGKEKLIGMSALWNTSPSRVVVAGATYDPSTTARIVKNSGELYVNQFYVPEWGKGQIDYTQVKKFTDYLEYLIPDKDSRAYFLLWLAAKAQDMSFRGAAIVMVADRQGVGRSTLADMIKVLLGGSNVADVPLTEMTGSSQFNEWQEKPFIVSEETLSGDPKLQYNTYEKLKTFIDPRSRVITINPKYGQKRDVVAHASYLFLSNHVNAIAIPEDDRRFFVLKNADVPASPRYFTKLNDWLKENDTDGMPLWGRHVFRWLQTVSVDMEKLTAPPPKTEAKHDMAGEALSDIDFAVSKLIDMWPDPYINAAEVFGIFENPLLAGPLHFDEETNRRFVKRAVNVASKAYTKCPSGVSLDGKTVRPRLMLKAIAAGSGFVPMPSDAEQGAKALIKLQEHYHKRHIDADKLAADVSAALHEDDRV